MPGSYHIGLHRSRGIKLPKTSLDLTYELAVGGGPTVWNNDRGNQIPPQHEYMAGPKINMYVSGFLVANNANLSRKGIY